MKTDKGITFSNKDGKLYDIYYQDVNPWQMTYCNRYISHGDYNTCPEGGNIDAEKVLKYFGLILQNRWKSIKNNKNIKNCRIYNCQNQNKTKATSAEIALLFLMVIFLIHHKAFHKLCRVVS